MLYCLLLTCVLGQREPAPREKVRLSPDPSFSTKEEEEQYLQDQGIKFDEDSLLAFLERHGGRRPDHHLIRRRVKELGSDSLAEREAASRDLVAMKWEAEHYLTEAVLSTDAEVSRRASACRRRIRAEERVFRYAAKHLLRQPSADAVRKLLRFKDREARWYPLSVMWSLNQTDWPRKGARWGETLHPWPSSARAELRQGLLDDDIEIRRLIAGALDGITGNDPLPWLKALSQAKHPEQRGAAFSLLRRHKDNPGEVLPLVNRALGDPDDLVRSWAIMCLGAFGESDRMVPLLIKATKLKGKGRSNSTHRCEALFQAGNVRQRVPEMLGALKQYFNSTDKMERSLSVRALGGIGSGSDKAAKLVLPIVERLSASADSSVEQAALAALVSMGERGAELVPVLVERMEERLRIQPAKNRSIIALLVTFRELGKMSAPAVPILIRVLKNEAEWASLRAESASALGAVGPKAKEAVPALVSVLSRSEDSLGFVAELALKKIDPTWRKKESER